LGQEILTVPTKYEVMNLSQDELLSQLRGMDEYEFEELVADVWEQRGWQTTVTTGSSDRGIDVIAQKSSPFSQKHLIQAKRYSVGNKIGSPDIQQYSSLRRQESDVDAVVVVTTSSFTSQAKQTANDLNVKLIGGEELSQIILNLDSQSFLSDYFNTATINEPLPKTRAREIEKAFLDFFDVEIDLIGIMSTQAQMNGFSGDEGITAELSEKANELVYSGFKHLSVKEELDGYFGKSEGASNVTSMVVKYDLDVRQVMAILVETGGMVRAWREVHELTLESDPTTQTILGLVFTKYSLGWDAEKEDA